MDTIKRLLAELEKLTESEENQRRIDAQRRLNNLEVVHPAPFDSQSFGSIFPYLIQPWCHKLGMPLDLAKIGRAMGPLDAEYALPVIEFQLRQKIDAFKNSHDDIPISPVIQTNLGLCWLYRESPVGERYRTMPETGAFHAVPILETEADFDRLELKPYVVDEELSKQRKKVFEDILEGHLFVADDGLPGGVGAPFQTANNLRGVQQVLEDMIERPHLVHRLMEFVVRATLEHAAQVRVYQESQKAGGGVFGCAGVFGCDEVSCDMFPPSFYDEFVHPYEMRVAHLYDSIYYHSCADITALYPKIMKIPNMRKVQVSPFSNLKTAIEIAQGKMILEYWVNQTLDLDSYSREEMRAYVRQVTDLGTDYPLGMLVLTQTPGGKLYRDVFYEEIGA